MYSDSHSHVDAHPEDQLASILEEARASGVEMVVGVSSTLEAAKAAIDYARRFPMIIPSVGMHPWYVTPLDKETRVRMRELAGQKEVAAIGEVGIDLEKEPSTRELQWLAFQEQLALARELDLPLIMHCGGARQEMQDVLRRHLPIRGVVHAFSGNRAETQSWMDLGLYISIGVRSFARSTPAFEEAVRAIPLDRMLLETDSSARSYASEEGLHPARVLEVAGKVARLHGATPEEVGRRTTANLRAMLRR